MARFAARSRLAELPRATDISGFLRQLSLPTRGSAVRAVIDGVVVTFALKKRGRLPVFDSIRSATGRPDADRSRDVSAAVDAGLSLIPVAPTCLRRSVTLVRELNRLGLGSTMHVGVRTIDGRVEAHAWVQAGADVVNDDAAVRDEYVELVAGQLDAFLPLLR